uniref:Uncharacterized protein n=1 Tax=Acrobeloides nanus TaxID=290746 RepID=A0A914DNR2_9BILA
MFKVQIEDRMGNA